ncbi:hypothetical protein Tco_0342005, partial [Tanacetum coccineum]
MAIKKWTFERLAAQNKDREILSNNLLEWDIKAENGLINEADIIKREEWLLDLNQLDQLVRDDLRQKCRVKWAVEGDENTRNLFRKLSEVDAKFLESGFSLEEVKEAV